MDISVIIPAYNEAGRILSTLGRIDKYLRSCFKNYEIIVANDGSQWLMYHCGYYSSTNSDAIFRSTSSDGVNWSAPSVVLTVGPQGSWDSGHVCDPSVLKGVNINGYSWAMWYTAIACQPGPSEPCTSNHIGLALSNEGINWIKYSGNPVINCGNALPYYGCGQQSVVKVGSTYYMSHTAAFTETVQEHQLTG